MHTLKGGARLVGMLMIGDIAHLMESVIEKIPDYDDDKLREAKTLLDLGHEALYGMLDSMLREEMPQPADALNAALTLFADEGIFRPPAQHGATEPLETVAQAPLEEKTPDADGDGAAEVEGGAQVRSGADGELETAAAAPLIEAADHPFFPADNEAVASDQVTHRDDTVGEQMATATEKTSPAVSEPGDLPAQMAEDSKKTGKAQVELHHYVRVDAALLDEMIAMIGEIAIMRSRIERLTAESAFNLSELTRIATRIDQQMRRLDNETETQMLFRRATSAEGKEGFDPLELDRFTEIQQLSRQLAEAIDDLKSVQETLSGENALVRNLSEQQNIIQRALQDKLMSTQLLRFDVNESRLRRLTRQTAQSVGKEVSLVLEGGDMELERHLLEDVLPPLEHMIRNAIDHGIATPEEREARGKPRAGTVRIAIASHASNLQIHVSDDGRGFDYNSIREKARAKGILDETRADEPAYLNALMLRSGLSTAESVTQLSGRGVGLDVVSDMIKQHSGHLEAESIPGQGVRFIISMPFSMRIAEVLLMEIAAKRYAVPMNAVVAVGQVEAQALRRSYDGEKVYHNYNGVDYRLFVLGRYFDPRNYVLDEHMTTAPVLFINGSEPVAFHVDHIGNRMEIIVKNVNRQVLNTPGISGATILGDGRVVPVLEVLGLIRHIGDMTLDVQLQKREKTQAKQILVVDDSVTMRKVSTRLLERNGYTVKTAKDGIDAIETLQDFDPDLILLDIEMPNMDGFEFTSYVRKDPQFAEVPIIMITSRTGEKHRSHAEAIGVQGYLGKPYREDILLKSITSLIGENAHG